MTTWFTSDLHFDHKRITEFTQRGKETAKENHTDWLINLWNTQVKPGDLVYHLGDFSFDKHYEAVASVVGKLNGQIIMLKGNHDKHEYLEQLKNDGLIVNYHQYKEISLHKTSTCLFHFPISSWHKQSYGSWHLHGHCHSNHNRSHGFMLDVGLDNAYNLFGKHKFFSEQDVLEYMQSQRLSVADSHCN